MPRAKNHLDIYLEVGSKRVFAGVCDWPGWCRSGRDELSALQTLSNYTPRYARVLRGTRLEFATPDEAAELVVTERLKGSATTDFGTPGAAPSCDKTPVREADLRRFEYLLNACWRAFDAAVRAGEGKTLRLGPRGGGRDLARIVDHVIEAELLYLAQLGVTLKLDPAADLQKQMATTRRTIIKGLAASARGELPKRGPRGGLRWGPRYMVRRVAWHVLDHAWEIEDRIE